MSAKKYYFTLYNMEGAQNEIIQFGKLKGQPFSVLKAEEHKKYCRWVMDQQSALFRDL